MAQHAAAPSLRTRARERTARTYLQSLTYSEACGEIRRMPLGRHGAPALLANRQAWVRFKTRAAALVEVSAEQADRIFSEMMGALDETTPTAGA